MCVIVCGRQGKKQNDWMKDVLFCFELTGMIGWDLANIEGNQAANVAGKVESISLIIPPRSSTVQPWKSYHPKRESSHPTSNRHFFGGQCPLELSISGGRRVVFLNLPKATYASKAGEKGNTFRWFFPSTLPEKKRWKMIGIDMILKWTNTMATVVVSTFKKKIIFTSVNDYSEKWWQFWTFVKKHTVSMCPSLGVNCQLWDLVCFQHSSQVWHVYFT